LWDILQYKVGKKGVMADGILKVLAWTKTRLADSNVPDIQYHLVPGLIPPDLKSKKWVDKGSVFTMFNNTDHSHMLSNYPKYGVTILTTLLHPKSKGSIELASSDPLVPPLINTNYLDDSRDIDTLVEGTKFGRTLITTPAFENKIKKIHLRRYDSSSCIFRRIH